MELALAVEQRFGFSADPAPVTVGQLMVLAQGLVEKPPPKPPPAEWFRAPSDEEPLRIQGETIPEAFVAHALADRRGVAAADDLSGVVSLRRSDCLWVLVMACCFEHLPTANVGLMLPASVACDTMLLGLLLAGKRPVLLNWTTGPANLHHAARLTGLTHVITSWRLRDRLGLAIEGVQFLDVEDLRRQIGWLERIRTFLAVRLLPGNVRRRVPQTLPDASAVILFTSGSEKVPKAVPLTHRNILANQRGTLSAIGLTSRDAVLSFLPMFHSFGFTLTGLLPLLAGVRVVHHPDPTEATARPARSPPTGRPLSPERPSSSNTSSAQPPGPGELASLRLIFVGRGKVSFRPVRESSARGAEDRIGGRIRRHGVLAVDRGEPARSQPPG